MRRRDLLAACAVGLTGSAGCSSLSWTDDDERPDVDMDALAADVRPVSAPSPPFPEAVVTDRAMRHRDRARTLLDRVPATPSIPNEAVLQELERERPDAEDRPPASPPDDRSTLDWLDDWRDYRADAAAVEAAYQAATGTDGAADFAARRRSVRERIGDLWAESDYRAPDPVTAAAGHAPVEALVESARSSVQRRRAYPSDPVADPFDAGAAVRRVERAAAAVADAASLRGTLVGPDTPAHEATLATATVRLRRSLDETTEGLDPYVERREGAFGRELNGADRSLFEEATRSLVYLREEAREADDDGRYATAVVGYGQALLAARVMSAVVTGIRNHRYPDEVTETDVREAAADAGRELREVLAADPSPLAVALARFALSRRRGTVWEMREGYAYADEAYAAFTRVAMYARGVPAATQFVSARLERPKDGE